MQWLFLKNSQEIQIFSDKSTFWRHRRCRKVKVGFSGRSGLLFCSFFPFWKLELAFCGRKLLKLMWFNHKTPPMLRANWETLTIWKSKQWMDPLGSLLFPKRVANPNGGVSTWSINSCNAKLPVPGCMTLAANLFARLWNESPDIQNAETLGAAKKAARNLSKSLL